MSYIPQQSDYEVLYQSKRVVYSKIELLNKEFKILEQLDGELLDDNYSVDADSDIRRTYNLTLIIRNSSFIVGQDKKIWFDKYIRLFIGLYSLRKQDVVWYPVGVFLFENAGYSYNTTTKELSLSCLDRMAEFTGSRNGQIAGLSLKIPSGSSLREAILSTITQLGKINKYRIESIDKTIPYDLEFGVGAFIYDIVKELRDLYPGKETFFDEDTFVYQSYPTCKSDPIVLDAKTLSSLIISENTDINFTQIHNVAEVWGKCLETSHYSDVITYSGGIYKATYGSITTLTDGLMIGFKASAENVSGSYFKVNNLTAYPILGEGGVDVLAGRILTGSSYVLKFVSNGIFSYFYFCGQYQIGAVVKLVSKVPSDETIAFDLLNEPTTNITYLVNPSSPFACDLIGEIRKVYSSGEYANIYSEDLATTRGKYEVWKSTDLLDSISLEMIEIPWLDVNTKIEYTSNATGLTAIYIVKKKSGSSTGSTMTIQCTKFQPLYYWTT